MLNKKNFQTEEGILFIKEYGEDNLYIWQDMTETQKKEYLEIEHQYSIFCDLYQNNYEDLKYYSTMYRNVSLHSIGKDPISVLYFASKHKEIIGYKKKLFKDISPKAKIAILYNENPALFPKVVEKLIGQKIHRSYPKTSKVDFYIYEELKRGNYESVFSVNDLSESECEKIIKIESKILDEYRLVYDECSEAFAPKLSTEDIKNKDYFITNYFIPQILSDKNPDSIQTKRINHFINSLGYIELPYLKKEYQDYLQIYRQSINIRANLGLSFSEQEDTVFKPHYEYVSSYRFQISILEGKLRGLNFKTCQLNSQLFRILPPTETLQKIKETHKEYKNIKKEIEETEKELENLKTREREEYSNWLRVQEEVKEKYKQEKQKEEERITQEKERLEQKRTDALLELKNKIKNTDLFEFVLANYENIEQYIVSSCERLYNILWLRNSEKIKIRESHTTGTVCIRDLMCETHRTLGESYFGWLKSKKTDKYIFRFSKRRLFADYGCVLQLEKKEKERIQKELFAKRREEEFKKQKIEEEKKRKEEEARREKYNYNKRNFHHRDAYISFDDKTHTYLVDGQELQSVTTIISNCFPQFNAEHYARLKAAKTGQTIRKILDDWDRQGKESRELGTSLHKNIENYFLGKIISNNDESYRLFKCFINKVNLEPYRTEWSIYDVRYRIAGTIDFVDYQNGEYIIYDWKRSDKLISNDMPVKLNRYNEKGNYPLEHIDNSPYYHYALQLSIYKYILENNYDIKISDLRLGIFHPSYTKPYIIRIPYLEKEVKEILQLRSEVLF